MESTSKVEQLVFCIYYLSENPVGTKTIQYLFNQGSRNVNEGEQRFERYGNDGILYNTGCIRLCETITSGY